MKRLTLVSLMGLLLFASCNNQQKDQNADTQAKENAMKASFNAYINECWNKKDTAKFKIITTENFVRYMNGVKVASNQTEMESVLNAFFTGFPDANVTTDNVVIKGNQSYNHWTFTGTNTGKFGEATPKGKKVNVSGYTVAHYNEDGKINQEDVYYNELQLMQQLGYQLTPQLFNNSYTI